MSKKEFLKIVRRGDGKFRVDNIIVSSGTTKLGGKGAMEVANGEFIIHLTLNAGSHVPELAQGYRDKKDFWLIQGIIEEEINFSMRSLPSNSSRNYNYGQPERSIMELSANRIELIPVGFDCLTNQQAYAIQQEAKQQAGIIETTPATDIGNLVTPANVQVTFFAVLPTFKLIEHNAHTQTTSQNAFLNESTRSTSDTFHGVMKGWKYGLIEREGDLHVYFLSEPEHQSLGENDDWRFFQAFLNALAFTHAQHAWPFSVEHRRDGKLYTDRIQINKDVANSPHAPFNKTLAFNNATKNLSWKFETALEKAYTFFSSELKLPREIENLLYIFREATAGGVPKRIVLLSLCSLLESLVRVIYEEEIALKKSTETSEFQKAKIEICEELKKKDQPVYHRLSAILVNAEPVNIRMRFHAAIEHIGLQPQDKWQKLYDLWSKFRNPISHRMSKGSESQESAKEELFAESRIAGAINCMILKLMSYSGHVRLSVFEDKYGKI